MITKKRICPACGKKSLREDDKKRWCDKCGYINLK